MINIVKNQRGFGFFGMLVLVIVLTSLGAIVMVSMKTVTSNQAMQETLKKMERLQTACVRYKADVGSNPTALADLVTKPGAVAACSQDVTNGKIKDWCGPYVEQIISNDATDYTVDGWGTTFSFTGGATVTITSYGPNKALGGGDDITRTF